MADCAGIYFSDVFQVSPKLLEQYGALNICLASDLPLFIDPFLLFGSEKKKYQRLHESIIRYLCYLRDNSSLSMGSSELKDLYCFREVKQNWLGFTALSNKGSGLGINFARSLNSSLGSILSNFGQESITQSSHLEKLAIIKSGVGRDCISDFTTNLIKGFLLDYTQRFAREHLKPSQCDDFVIDRAKFDYNLQSWVCKTYYLPKFNNDFVLLTPIDMLTKDDTWISRNDLSRNLFQLPNSVDDDILRSRLNRYLGDVMASFKNKRPTNKQRNEIVTYIVTHFPDVVDYYIRDREYDSAHAFCVSQERMHDVSDLLIGGVNDFVAGIRRRSYVLPSQLTSLDEARKLVGIFKDYIENNDGYKLINDGHRRLGSEKDVQLFFGLITKQCECDANREVNNGRGPVDFKLSNGGHDKTLIEFKLASNSSLKRNLENQVPIYEKANNTKNSLKVIICYTKSEQDKVNRVLAELGLSDDKSIILIDARNDNKLSASKA